METEICRFHFDGEMLGGVPGTYSLVEIGCCTIDDKDQKTSSILVRPDCTSYEYGAFKVLRRPYSEYIASGVLPQDAAHQFISFLLDTAQGRSVEISCVNPGFDFGFLKVFLEKHAPDTVSCIGFKAFDVVSYACGVFALPLGSMSTGKAWRILKEMVPELHRNYFPGDGTHNALQDALDQTKLLLALEAYVRQSAHS